MKLSGAQTVALLALFVSPADSFGVSSMANSPTTSSTSISAIDAALANDAALTAGASGGFGAVAAGLGAVFAGAVGYVATSTRDVPVPDAVPVEAEPEPIDVSIPYDAAARLAFASTGMDESKFDEYKPLYEAKVVADVTLKKMQRELKAYEDAVAKTTRALDDFTKPAEEDVSAE